MVSLEALPNEVQDRIFELVEDPRFLHPFLFSRSLHRSTVRTIYRDLRLDVCDVQGLDCLDFLDSFFPEFSTRAITSIHERLQHIETMVKSCNGHLLKTRTMAVQLLSARSLRTLHKHGLNDSHKYGFNEREFVRYLVAPDPFQNSPVRSFSDRRSPLRHYSYTDSNPGMSHVNLDMKQRPTPSRWGRFLTDIICRTPKLEILACDFFPSMWTDLDLDTYDMIPWLQNLHTLSLHGFRSLLDIRLSRLPNLRKLKLVNIGLLPSVDICKVTDLELEYSLCTRIQKAGPEIRNFMFPSCWHGVQLSGFNNLARLRITLSYLGRLRKSVRTQDLSICAATLRELELNVLGHWPPPVHPLIDERVKLQSLTNLIIPWARLAITGKSPLLDTPAVQKVEIRLTERFDNPHDFANDLVDFLTDEQVARAFPSLRAVKITIEEPGNKKWRTEIRSIMEHIERESIGGSLGGIPFIKRDEFLKGCIELQLGDRGGLVLDLSGIFICLMMHDATVNWSSLP